MEVITEIFKLLIMGSAMLVVTLLMVKNQKLAVYSSLFIFALFCIQHLYMSTKLSNVKEEFKAIAMHGPQRIESHVSDGESYRSTDYDGELDEVIDKRDSLLRKHGYSMLGDWYVKMSSYSDDDISVSTTALYLWFPL